MSCCYSRVFTIHHIENKSTKQIDANRKKNVNMSYEFMFNLGPSYFTLPEIIRKLWKTTLFSEIFQISWI